VAAACGHASSWSGTNTMSEDDVGTQCFLFVELIKNPFTFRVSKTERVERHSGASLLSTVSLLCFPLGTNLHHLKLLLIFPSFDL